MCMGLSGGPQKILLKSDNMVVVTITKSGYTKDPYLVSYVRNIWLLTATHDIQLNVIHIPGKTNTVADLLSRWDNRQHSYQKLNRLIEHPIWHEVNQQNFYVNMGI